MRSSFSVFRLQRTPRFPSVDFTGFQHWKLVRIQNPAVPLDHAKREIVAARFFEIPAEAVIAAAREETLS